MVGVVRWLPRCRDRICRRRADEQGKLPDVHLDLHVTHFCFLFRPPAEEASRFGLRNYQETNLTPRRPMKFTSSLQYIGFQLPNM